jgi:hypothetical protein
MYQITGKKVIETGRRKRTTSRHIVLYLMYEEGLLLPARQIRGMPVCPQAGKETYPGRMQARNDQ